MSFRLSIRSPEQLAIEKRIAEIYDHELKVAKGPAIREKLLEANRLEKRLAELELADFEKERRALLEKKDDESKVKRLSVEAIQSNIRSQLEPEKRAFHRQRSDELAAQAAALRKEIEAKAARANVAQALKHAPWLASRPASDAIVPNGCATCANSAARFTPEARANEMTTLTAGAARDAIAAKYPSYVKPGPMTTKVLRTSELIEHACGKGAGACAHMGSSTVTLPTNPSASLVNHETLHALTSPKWGDRVPRTVNESVTEYFNRKMGYFGPGGSVSKKAYEGGQPLLNGYLAAKPGREDALAKAYFTGDFSALEALEDRPSFGKAAPGDVLNSRLAQWDSLLKNRRSGASVTIDDEELPAPPLPPVLSVVPGI